jgi:hypothetical protein
MLGEIFKDTPGYGLMIVIAVVSLIIVIVTNTCTNWTYEGFIGVKRVDTTKAAVPMPTSLTDHTLKDVTGTSSVTDLPSAPIASLAETNSRPQTDPAMEKATVAMINELKQDMDGFHKNEYPHIKDRSDPAINLPLTRFQGDYQRLKDELSVLKMNPGIPAQVSVQEVSDIGANLRYLQRTYRDLANVELVPTTDLPYSRVGAEGFAEGFATDDGTKPITLAQLKLLQTSISAETMRLQASGSTDPIIGARVRVFTNIGNTVNDLVTKVSNGNMGEADIPITVNDYAKFLPALGDSSAGIGGLLSDNGLGALSNLFNAYDAGDASGSQVAAALFQAYAKQMGDGLSFNVSYTSPNELAKDQALATYAKAYGASMAGTVTQGSRGEFERTIQSIDAFESGLRPASNPSGNPGKFDWKARADAIAENISRAGMNPADFGCLEKGAAVSPGYSWRGHAKMICSRLSTNADPAIPEQMGCPPVSWKGWRS